MKTADKIRGGVESGLIAEGSVWLPISPEALANLSEDWSAPVEAKVEDGELVFRHPEQL